VPGDSDITWKGILVGFLLAGIVGYVMSRMLWAGGLGPVRAFFKPQTVVHKTKKSPFEVLLGCLGRIAILGVSILAILYLTGMLEHYFPSLPWASILRALHSDQILTLLVVGLILIIVAIGLGASEKGNQEQK
jgi:NO-binding membrane sensor protein with MHYT domain